MTHLLMVFPVSKLIMCSCSSPQILEVTFDFRPRPSIKCTFSWALIILNYNWLQRHHIAPNILRGTETVLFNKWHNFIWSCMKSSCSIMRKTITEHTVFRQCTSYLRLIRTKAVEDKRLKLSLCLNKFHSMKHGGVEV